MGRYLKSAFVVVLALLIIGIASYVITHKAPASTTTVPLPAPLKKHGSLPMAPVSTVASGGVHEKELATMNAGLPPVSIGVSEGKFIIEVRGYLEQVGFYKPGDTLPTAILWSHSFVSMARSKEDVIADRVFINRTYMRIEVDTSKLLAALKPGVYEVIAWSDGEGVLRAHVIITRSGISIINSEVIGSPTSVCSATNVCGEFKLICYINDTSLKKVRSVIYGSRENLSIIDAVWLALKWVDENIAYDREKFEEGNYELRDPITMLKLRRGICMDYSGLLTAALLSIGVEPVYIVGIDNVNHVTPAVKINNSLFVLDQVLPPIEISDYIDYILLGSRNTVSVFKYWIVNGEVQLEAENNVELNITDAYPSDEFSAEVFNEAVRLFIKRHPELIPNSKLEPLLRAVGSELRMYTPVLIGYGSEGRYPITVLYSPLFREWWAKMLADYMEQLARKYYNSVLKSRGYFWASLSNSSLRFIAVSYEIPNSSIALLNDSARVSILSRGAIVTLNILIYRHGSTDPSAVIAPSSTSYTNITVVRASKWVITGSKAYVEFNMKELSKVLPSGVYDLVVWVNGNPIYASTVKIERNYRFSSTIATSCCTLGTLIT